MRRVEITFGLYWFDRSDRGEVPDPLTFDYEPPGSFDRHGLLTVVREKVARHFNATLDDSFSFTMQEWDESGSGTFSMRHWGKCNGSITVRRMTESRGFKAGPQYKQKLYATLTATDAWHDKAEVDIVWKPKIVSDEWSDVDYVAWGDIDDPPVVIYRSRQSGGIRHEDRVIQFAGSSSWVVSGTRVDTDAELTGGRYRVLRDRRGVFS